MDGCRLGRQGDLLAALDRASDEGSIESEQRCQPEAVMYDADVSCALGALPSALARPQATAFGDEAYANLEEGRGAASLASSKPRPVRRQRAPGLGRHHRVPR